MALAVPEPALDQDDDDTDEEVFDELKSTKSPELDTEMTSDAPRSDSALTVALEVDTDHHIAPINLVDLASPGKSSTSKPLIGDSISDDEEEHGGNLREITQNSHAKTSNEIQGIYYRKILF